MLQLHIVFGVALRLKRPRAEDGVQKLRTLRRPRTSGFSFSSPLLLLEGASSTHTTSSLLLLLLFGLRHHHLDLAAGRIDPEKAKNSVPPSATELLHQLLVFDVAYGADEFVSGNLNSLWINV